MMAIRTIGLALGLIGGIVLAGVTHWTLPPFILLAISISAAAVLLYEIVEERRWHAWPIAAVLTIAFICALPLGYWRAASLRQSPSSDSLRHALTQLADGDTISIRGNICHEPELRKAGQVDVRVRVDSLRVGKDEDALVLSQYFHDIHGFEDLIFACPVPEG